VIENLIMVLRINGDHPACWDAHANLRALPPAHPVDQRGGQPRLLDGPPSAPRCSPSSPPNPSIRRSNELLPQLEVLSPNNPTVYSLLLDGAGAGAATRRRPPRIIERARRVKGLDHTAGRGGPAKRWIQRCRRCTAAARRARQRADPASKPCLGGARRRPRVRCTGPGRSAATRWPARCPSSASTATEPALLVQGARWPAAARWPGARHPRGLIASTLIRRGGARRRRPRPGIAPAPAAQRGEPRLDKLVADHNPLAAKNPRRGVVGRGSRVTQRRTTTQGPRSTSSLAWRGLNRRSGARGARPARLLDDKLGAPPARARDAGRAGRRGGAGPSSPISTRH